MWNVVFTTSIVYTLYVVLGGCIFLFLEGINELEVAEVKKENASISFTEMHFILLERNFSEDMIEIAVNEYDDDFSDSYFGNQSVVTQYSWTYSNAFFFAFHLCSTIGYGDRAPSTYFGRLLVVFYATFGIPVHILFYKLLGESFAQSYQETMIRMKSSKDSDRWRVIKDIFGFFLPWTVIFFILPSVIFMFTETWNFAEGIYYSFITLTTVGLGDYVAGNGLSNSASYTVYKIVILTWMIYGMAFTSMVIDYLTHQYQMHLLFSCKCKWMTCYCPIHRIYVDIEKMDIHFRLLRSEGVKHKYSMWAVRKGARKMIGFQTTHMGNLALLAERIQGELIDLLKDYETERSADAPKDAFPVKVPKDAFPVKKRESDGSTANDSASKKSLDHEDV